MATVSKQKKFKKVRQKLKLFRANEPLKSVLMWGINYSFTALGHVKPRVMLLKDDFKAYMKVKINNYMFNKYGSILCQHISRDHMPSRFKFKEYCPMVFKALRDRFGVDKLDYWDAFTGHQPLWDSTRGKSGSRFLVTYNRQFVAKTISSEEVEQLHQMLEEYYAYIVHCHGQTLLPQYLGLYRLNVNDQETHILIMRNVFSPRLAVHKKFDLKGSTIDREANEKEKSKPLPTLKDTDFLNDICKIHVGGDAKTRIMNIMNSDVQFLQENNLMDYSLLIGIHDVPTEATPAPVIEETASVTATDPDGLMEERVVSAGDGLGCLSPQWKLRRLSAVRNSIVEANIPAGASAASAGGGNTSAGDDEDEDEIGVLSDTGIPMPEGLGNLTPPDSPPEGQAIDQIYNGYLHPRFEFYGIKSSSDSPKQRIYFVAIIDILTRYGMRKRTAQTYKSVKHGAGAEISTVKPEVYGRRLLDFMSQCID